jgi:hypothetical protein
MTKRILDPHFQGYWILIVIIWTFQKTSFIHKYSEAQPKKNPPTWQAIEFEPKTFFKAQGPIQGLFIESSSLRALMYFFSPSSKYTLNY